ncbi:probable 2-oxoglutarate-dependent dioxygenase AOP1 isoform X2 [Ricinus communis]|uniref:2-oxoglutarate-dependent dioxygenase DAO n=1 Tax=Ricinus communis TaxID=3988 RepID=B9RPC8_RICCO|nr:probable 2-oxoglutarate-dependent dioxygenase AOP1 isoform X2 [Ricinus communis]EEF47046.1 Gibberellin 2-beta-dioxygenase, putative [Ricinus communis]|eukprot:XP_002515597.1 probable 2-oxoglutarate-dependent dioxygenase AOP1 isoform X2 [Ricinus communis]
MAKAEIPTLYFSGEALSSGSESRRELCNRVRKACESHGCFLLMYDHGNIPAKLRQNLFVSMKALFDLPEDTKTKYVNPKPYRSYTGRSPVIPFYESFGLDDAHKLGQVQDFTNLMWPQGNTSFCEILHVMSSKMLEMNLMVLKMIFESFGMEKHYDSHIQDSTSLFKVMKYIAPPSNGRGSGEDSAIALRAHRDKNAITILCQNEVQGLEVESKDGEWARVMVPQDAFVVIVGEALKVWSNGRLEAARHRVVINGKEDRYSCALFSMPKEESKIEVPCELVDKDHPLLYRPFIFSDYISYFVSKLSDDALEIYAGI